MNISQENASKLTATIKIELEQQDYEPSVENALKDLQKKVTLKGFRPGKVPPGLIKKMYGKAAMAEEVNKILSESLNNYIEENKLDLLGQPIANEEKNGPIDFENVKDISFHFDIGLAPQFEIDLSTIEHEYYEIIVEDEKVEDYMKNVRLKFGNPVNAETVEPEDMVKGQFLQVDADGNPIEEGWMHDSTVSLKFLTDEEAKNLFSGKKIADTIRFNPLKATENEIETAHMLGIEKENKALLESDYSFTISEITRMEPAEVNQEFFRKVYPAEEIETEEQFREKLREEAKVYFQHESDNFFTHDAMEKIVRETEVLLPDDFLKRWLKVSNEKMTDEIIEKEYRHYEESLRSQLIVSRIGIKYGIKVEEADVRNHFKETISRYYMADPSDEAMSENLNTMATSLMKNKEEVNKVYERLFDEQLRQLLKDQLKLNRAEVTYTQFIEKVNEHHKQHHHHEHEE